MLKRWVFCFFLVLFSNSLYFIKVYGDPIDTSPKDTVDSGNNLSNINNNNKFDNFKRSEPEGEDNNTPTSENNDELANISLKNSNSVDNFTGDIFQSTKDNGKINVQVTVLVGELARHTVCQGKLLISDLHSRHPKYRQLYISNDPGEP